MALANYCCRCGKTLSFGGTFCRKCYTDPTRKITHGQTREAIEAFKEANERDYVEPEWAGLMYECCESFHEMAKESP